MVFTPGYPQEKNVRGADVVATETVVFSMGADRNKVPFPQYYVNGQAYDPTRIDFFAHPGTAREYLLINQNNQVHSFHIHANQFQIKEMGTEMSIEKYPMLKSILHFDPLVWRDTIFVPPKGRARIWVQHKNSTEKTVFHCHFLAQ